MVVAALRFVIAARDLADAKIRIFILPGRRKMGHSFKALDLWLHYISPYRMGPHEADADKA